MQLKYHKRHSYFDEENVWFSYTCFILKFKGKNNKSLKWDIVAR